MERRPFLQQVVLVITTWCFAVIWVQLAVRLLRWLLSDGAGHHASIDLSVMPSLSVLMHYLPQYRWGQELLALGPKVSMFMAFVFAPLVEEAIFRLLPLGAMLFMTRKLGHEERHYWRMIRAMVLIVFCCIIFGLAHSVLGVFIQGAVGLFLGILFLKNAPEQWFAAYITCVCVHSLYNITVSIW